MKTTWGWVGFRKPSCSPGVSPASRSHPRSRLGRDRAAAARSSKGLLQPWSCDRGASTPGCPCSQGKHSSPTASDREGRNTHHSISPDHGSHTHLQQSYLRTTEGLCCTSAPQVKFTEGCSVCLHIYADVKSNWCYAAFKGSWALRVNLQRNHSLKMSTRGKNLVWWCWEVVTQINPVFGLMVSSCHIRKGVGGNQHICHGVRCDTPSPSFLCKICHFLLKTVKAHWRQTGRRWYITTAEMTNYNIIISDSSGNLWKKLSFGRQAFLNAARKSPSSKCTPADSRRACYATYSLSNLSSTLWT